MFCLSFGWAKTIPMVYFDFVNPGQVKSCGQVYSFGVGHATYGILWSYIFVDLGGTFIYHLYWREQQGFGQYYFYINMFASKSSAQSYVRKQIQPSSTQSLLKGGLRAKSAIKTLPFAQTVTESLLTLANFIPSHLTILTICCAAFCFTTLLCCN